MIVAVFVIVIPWLLLGLCTAWGLYRLFPQEFDVHGRDKPPPALVIVPWPFVLACVILWQLGRLANWLVVPGARRTISVDGGVITVPDRLSVADAERFKQAVTLTPDTRWEAHCECRHWGLRLVYTVLLCFTLLSITGMIIAAIK